MNMKKIILILLVIALLPALSAYTRDASRIQMDGNFTDWENINPLYSDASGDQNSGNIDFRNLKIVNDDRFVFFYLEIMDELNLQGNNSITIYLDTDNDTDNGFSINGIGAELKWEFGDRDGTYYSDSGNYVVYHEYIGLITSPTVTSTVFEIAMARNSELYGDLLFPEDNFKIVIKDNSAGQDILPESGETLTYFFDETSLPEIPEISLQKPENSDFRILTYNVLSDGFFETNLFDNYDRILSALGPEIICFQEIYDHSAYQTKNLVEQMLPSSGNENWYYDEIWSDIIIVSRFPVLESFYSDGNGVFLLDLSSQVNSELLIVNAHLPAGDNDYDRQIEIDKIMKFIREAKEPGGYLYLEENTPIIILGDLNLVGYAQQLETLITGEIVNQQYGPSFAPDWDGTDLTDLTPRQTELYMYYTWYNDWSSYSPGRLDFMIYTDHALSAENCFVLFTPEMSAVNLATYGLQSNDSTEASDHLPTVSDFRVLFPNNAENPDLEFEWNFNIYPNPVKTKTTIDYQINKRSFVEIEIYNLKGQLVEILVNEDNNKGVHSLDWNVNDLSSGIYLMRFSNNEFTQIRKCLVVK